KALEPFYTTKRNRNASGIGLSICYGIIGEHYGTIMLESEYMEGTTVIIKLPLEGSPVVQS
ncbi:MAG: HAMP domain-containing histidine kinase, partial [Nitrospirae bacterium]|nr:HAMP domain-containing histidine kinase [Nitrospirota bacterium]